MEYRKLIAFGKGGYVLSMPKDWVVQNRIGKGGIISIKRQGVSLSLTPNSVDDSLKNKEVVEHVIDIDGLPTEIVKRMLISAYLNPYDTIYIRGEELVKKLGVIKKTIQALIAWEIIESTRNKLVVKDFLDFRTIDIREKFRKMDIIVRSVFFDLLEQDDKILDNVKSRDYEVSRHYYLVIKGLRKLFSDQSLLKAFDMTLSEALVYWNNVLILESISDGLVRFIELFQDVKLDKKASKELFGVLEEVNKMYLDVMRSHYKQDSKKALLLRSKKHEIGKRCEQLQKRYWDQQGMPVLLETLRHVARNNHRVLRSLY